MATIKKSVGNSIVHQNTYCDVLNEDGYSCIHCKFTKITEPFGDLKCIYKNHVINNNAAQPYVCEDFRKR